MVRRKMAKKAERVNNAIARLCTSLHREKNRKQSRKLEEFAGDLPGLEGVREFLTSQKLDDVFNTTLELKQPTTEQLADAMLIVCGCLMLR